MRRRGPVVVAVAFGVAVLIAIFFFVLPKMHAVDKARNGLESEQTKEQALQLRLAQLEQAKQEAPQTQQALAALKEKIPPTADIPGLIRIVADAADETGMNVSTLSPAAATADGSGKFAIIPVSLTVDGDYFSVQEFLLKLESLQRAMKVTGMQISTGAPPFELSVSLNVEVYTTDVNVAPPAA
ncbi:MAG: type 4a pilus biogenesis protein PilO [Actinomycetota bacterium]